MSILDRINSGEFENRKPFLERVRKPDLLSKPAGNLTADEINNLPSIRGAYELAVQTAKTARAELDAETSQLTQAFAVALLEEHGIPAGHPFGQALFDIAWDRGHSSGYRDVASCFDDLAPLWEMAQKMVRDAKEKK